MDPNVMINLLEYNEREGLKPGGDFFGFLDKMLPTLVVHHPFLYALILAGYHYFGHSMKKGALKTLKARQATAKAKARRAAAKAPPKPAAEVPLPPPHKGTEVPLPPPPAEGSETPPI
ncbi:hypothetical protein HanIR_Chr11g0548521 [Helianthus annuus]|nr:hypothetical protein HanIR_Chr11g0548521 [Helianthus annuus]